MGCPFHDGDDSEDSHTDHSLNDQDERGIERRAFMKSALVIGGTSALTSVTGLYGMPETGAATSGSVSIAERENRQHAWDAYERYLDAHEKSIPPEHHLLLHVDYLSDSAPTPADRKTVAEALHQLEEAFEWHHTGLLFTVGYSLSYFRRFDEYLPPGLDPAIDPVNKPGLLDPRTLIEADGVTLERERPVTADEYDACIHLSSDHVQHLLAAEAALWGEQAEVNDVSFDATFEGIFTKPEHYPERRVGFAGHENVVSSLEEDTDFDTSHIPGTEGDEDDADPTDDEPKAALSMGFNDQYKNSVPRETHVTILEDQRLVEPKPPGVFAQGTIQHVSKLDINLGEWYDDHDMEGRRERMFSPHHTHGNTGDVGENLGKSNAPGERAMRDLDGESNDIAEVTERDATSSGVTGHAQKTARARFDMQTRLTESGQERLSGGETLLPADERDDDLPGHDGNQEAEQTILRRDVDTTDQRRPGNHFVALMRFNPYMVYMRQAMNGVAFDTASFGLDGEDRIQHDAIGAGEDSGIVGYLETQRRGNYLVPPITLRALPHPRGAGVDIEVSAEGDTYRVGVDGLTRDELAVETVRFGWFYDVNRGRGATPTDIEKQDGTLVLTFPAGETGIDTAPGGPDDDVRVRLFGKHPATRRPLRGTATIEAPSS